MRNVVVTRPSLSMRLLDYVFGIGPKYKNRYRIIEIASILGYLALSALIAHKVWQGVAFRPSVFWLLPWIGFAAIIGADLVSGLVHWACDTYGTPKTTFVGPKFIAPFREHHHDPKAMTRHDFVEANGDNCFTTLFVMTPTYLSLDEMQTTWEVVSGLWMLLFTFGVLMTSIAHGWAHSDDCGRIIRFMQRKRIVVSPEHHAKHHIAPHLDHYCITTGWLNPLLDRIRFFRGFEWFIALFGYRPSVDRDSDPAIDQTRAVRSEVDP